MRKVQFLFWMVFLIVFPEIHYSTSVIPYTCAPDMLMRGNPRFPFVPQRSVTAELRAVDVTSLTELWCPHYSE